MTRAGISVSQDLCERRYEKHEQSKTQKANHDAKAHADFYRYYVRNAEKHADRDV